MPQQLADSSQAAQLAAVLAATQQQSAAIRQRLDDYVTRLWASLGSYRAPDMRRFVSQVVPVVAGAQQRMADTTLASLARQRQIALDTPFRPVAVDPKTLTGAVPRGGASPTEVYERPFHLVWRELANLPREDASIDKAIASGLARARTLAATDVQLTKRQALAGAAQRDDRLIGYRRVLEGTFSCAFCIVAATLRYRVDTVRERGGKLFPLHPSCDCGLQGIWDASEIQRRPTSFSVDAQVRMGDGSMVPISSIDGVHHRIADTFGRSSAAARSIGATGSKGRRIAYRDILVTHDHGELGQVFAVRGQSFLGPSEIAQHVN